MRGRTLGWMMLTALVLASQAGAQGVTDPGDLAFWQSIQSSKNAKEYRAYLQSYPGGRFAELAKVRAAQLEGGVPDAPPAPPDPEPPAYSFTISPRAGRVGQEFTVSCASLPVGSGDQIAVVPAGSPVMSPNRHPQESKVIWGDYTANCASRDLKGGPFAPGAYEARWMTILFNNDRGGRFEMKAMVPFTVR